MSDRDLLYSIAETHAEAARRAGHWLACRPGCHECCLGPFPITVLDAERLRAGLANADPRVSAAIRARVAAHAEDEDAPCPVLDPATGLCDLYDSRPVTCRVFGPAARAGNSVGACELCYEGATEAEIEARAVEFDPDGLESALIEQMGGRGIETSVAEALRV